MPMLLSTASTETALINGSIVTELVNLTKTVMGLFTEFPINVILIASLCGIAFGFIAKAKRAAR